MVTKAIPDLKLNLANCGKLTKLAELAREHQRVLQCYVDWLIAHEMREPGKYADIPEAAVPTPLSDRWQRCVWQQACGIVRSWYSNERTTPPSVKAVCIQANSNVVKLERSATNTFDFWLRVSTLDKGHPVRIPLKLYRRARKVLGEFAHLCSGVTLNQRNGCWYATLVVEKPNRKPHTGSAVVGVDIGMAAIASASNGEQYGQVRVEIVPRVERQTLKRTRKQKLNACLKRKQLPLISLRDLRAQAFVRNAIGRALNELLDALPEGACVAVERLNVAAMRFKSCVMNRQLRAAQLGYIKMRLRFKLDERGVRYRSVQAAYSSQQCSACGFVSAFNRRTQARFACVRCGFECNADVNAALNIAERFGDDELNGLYFRDVKAVLVERYQRRLSPPARSADAGLDTRVNEVVNPSPPSLSPVLTPVS